MKYGITVLALGPHPFIEISEHEFLEIKAAKQDLITFLGIEEKYDILLENYAEYERELLNLTLRRLLFSHIDWSSFREDVQTINRRIANLLTAIRLYIDQVKHDLVTLYGDESKQVGFFKLLLKGEHSSSLGYRVLDALRNYIQHRSLAVGGLSYPARWIGEEPNHQMPHMIVPSIRIADLQADAKFRADVLRELEAKGESVNITPLIREGIQRLSGVHETVRQFIEPRLQTSHDRFIDVCDRAREPLGGELTGLGIVAQAEDGSYLEMVHIVDDLAKRRQALCAKNRPLAALTRWYVSGEALQEG